MSTLDGGRTVGRYRIERFLGAGAMGEVYLAEDPQIERRLAIKTVRLAGRPQEMEDRSKRLLREARAAGRLLHPHIVTLFDTGEAEGLLYLAFEYVEGADLATRATTPPPLTLSEVLRMVRECAEALDYAHRQGIVHRDIKPSNILIDTHGRVKVADFGIAKMAGQSTELTVAGSVIGSPQYLSPEQIKGEDLDGRSDIFSLGVVLYELLSGRRPFDGETLTTLVYQILHKEPPAISELRGGVPPRLEALLGSMLAKERDDRPPTAGEVADEIAAVERELPDETLAGPAATDVQAVVPTRALPRRTTAQIPQAPPPQIPPPPPGSPGQAVPAAASAADPAAGVRRFVLAGIAVAVLALAGALGAGWWWLNQRGTMEDAAAVSTEAGMTAPGVEGTVPGGTAEGQPAGSGQGREGSVPGGTTPAGKSGGQAAGTAGAAPEGRAGAVPLATPAPPVVVAPPAGTPPSAGAAERGTVTSAPARPVPGDRSSASPQPSPADRQATSPALPSRGTQARPVPPEPAPPIPPPSTRPGTRVPVPAPVPVPERPAPPAVEEEPEPEPAPARVEADQRLRTGLNLTFQVTPPDAHILLDRTVIGRADEWSGKKGGRTYTLPGAGEYLIKIRKPGLREHRIAIEASETAGTTPISVRLQSLPAAEVASSDLPTYRVREGVTFRGAPADAEVLVDGRSQGLARQFAGGFGRGGMLKLPPGRHRVTVVSPGSRQRDFMVEVVDGAEKERERIDVSGGGGGR